MQYPGPWIAVADLNGDGKSDIVTDGVSVMLGNGDGTFSSSGGVAVANNFNSGFSSNVELGDFTGEGNLDVALVSLDENGNRLLNILLGNGKGAFTDPLTFPAGSSAVPPSNDDIDMADFNNDGMLDVVVGGPTEGIVLLQGTSK